MRDSDVLIAGAGPAGSIAALVLARAGARVRVIDRARFPREKLCGDTVNPGALAILRRLNLSAADDGLPVDGMIVTGESGVTCEGFYQNGCQGRALRRLTLDERLLAQATAAGAVLEEGVLVQSPLVENDRVRGLVVSCGGRRQSLTAPVVIAADGAGSRLARTLGLSRHRRHPRRWAVGAYFENVDRSADAPATGEMHVRRDRYIGIAPLPDQLTNVCVVTADRTALKDPTALICDTIRRDPQLVARFTRSRATGRATCLGPLAVDSTACGVPGLLLAGDAAGFIDPMTGDGLRFAFRGGELAGLAALSVLEHDTFDASGWLAHARRREFASKWRFNRTLRALVASAAAIDVATSVARVWPSAVAHIIRYAGDARADGSSR